MGPSGETLVYLGLAAVMVCVACAAVAAYCAVRCIVDVRQSYRTLTAVGQAADEIRKRGTRVADLMRAAEQRADAERTGATR